MTQIEHFPELNFLSELYAEDAPDAQLLAEYPSSNSDETCFRNGTKFIIHDPFPPPRKELIKVLGPHHLMCAWGRELAVTSEVSPSEELHAHWRVVFGTQGVPVWKPYDNANDNTFITLFPHQSLPEEKQVVDPTVNYAVHSKEVIEKIDCPQAAVLISIRYPCIVKLSHGYAGLGNFLINNADEEAAMNKQLAQHWPGASLVINSVIENIAADYGVQFYLRRDGSMIWLGLTEQHFDSNNRWCGGTFSAELQTTLFDELCQMIEPAGNYLHSRGYFGVVGIDILKDTDQNLFLVDVNPRLTGITPFLIASRIFHRDFDLSEGVYQASCQFDGSLGQLLQVAAEFNDAKVVVLSAFEDQTNSGKVCTICHLSVTSDSQERNQQILNQIFSD